MFIFQSNKDIQILVQGCKHGSLTTVVDTMWFSNLSSVQNLSIKKQPLHSSQKSTSKVNILPCKP